MNTRVNVRVAVNAASIRREQHNGREHIVVPSFTLPDGVVMNGGLYPHDEIEKSYASLEGTLAPLGHPQVNGEYVSAQQPDAINSYHVGAWNKNVRRVGNRIAIDKWVDVEYAKNSEGGRALLSAIDKGEPIHTSTGIFLEREMTPNADGYDWIARNMTFDHDALLVGEIGAATPEDGVGMMVNKTFVINSVVTNEDALDDSYGEKLAILSEAVKERFATSDSYAYVQDFDDRALVYCTPEGMYSIDYHFEGDNPILTGEARTVVAETSYKVKTNSVISRLRSVLEYFSTKTKQPVVANVAEETSDMKPEDLQAALDAQAEKLQGAFNTALAALEAKHGEALSAVNAQLQANSDAQLKDKRSAVAKVHGEVVANALSGEVLDAMFASVQTAAGLVSGTPATNAKDEFEGYSLNSADQEAK
jgi:hypothetical protein